MTSQPRPEPPGTITLGRGHAAEIAAGIADLGSWLMLAPQAIQDHFNAHAFPDPTTPGAHIEDFLPALHDAWEHLHDALGHTTAD